jgi:hypothetical protein
MEKVKRESNVENKGKFFKYIYHLFYFVFKNKMNTNYQQLLESVSEKELLDILEKKRTKSNPSQINKRTSNIKSVGKVIKKTGRVTTRVAGKALGKVSTPTRALIGIGMYQFKNFFQTIPLVELALTTYTFHPTIWSISKDYVMNISFNKYFCEDNLELFYFPKSLAEKFCESLRYIFSFIMYIHIINFMYIYLFAPGTSMIDYTKKYLSNLSDFIKQVSNVTTKCFQDSMDEAQKIEGLNIYKKATSLEGGDFVTDLLPDMTETAVSYGASLGLLGQSKSVDDFKNKLVTLGKKYKEDSFVNTIIDFGKKWIGNGEAKVVMESKEKFRKNMTDVTNVNQGTLNSVSVLQESLKELGVESIAELSAKPEAFIEEFSKNMITKMQKRMGDSTQSILQNTLSFILSPTPQGTIVDDFHYNFVNTTMNIQNLLIHNMKNSKFDLLRTVSETRSFNFCSAEIKEMTKIFHYKTLNNVLKFEDERINTVNNDILKFINVPEIKINDLPFHEQGNRLFVQPYIISPIKAYLKGKENKTEEAQTHLVEGFKVFYDPKPEIEQTVYVTSALILIVFEILFMISILKAVFRSGKYIFGKFKKQ